MVKKPTLCALVLLDFFVFALIGCGSSGMSSSSQNASPPTAHNEWVWMGGFNSKNQLGYYGTEGVLTSNALPPSRFEPTAWTDHSGSFWLFGGYSTPMGGDLNDLWVYSHGAWKWVGGSQQEGQLGVYGAQGIASEKNIPGARDDAVGWVDGWGNLWLFGGFMVGSSISSNDGGIYDDLWKYTNGEWTWVSGTSGSIIPGVTPGNHGVGVYGKKGVASAANRPGARYGASEWTDNAGNLWLFGGEGVDSQGHLGVLNDLWKYDTYTNRWTWMSGSDLVGAKGIYGTIGVPSPLNTPGPRANATSVADNTGNFWLFGGDGADAYNCHDSHPPCELNDLWKYDTSTNEWTWVGGSDLNNQVGVYGVEGEPAPENIPSSRNGAIGWIDSKNDIWIFGGISGVEDLNDLWKYNPATNEWTWMTGTEKACSASTYGIEGIPAESNTVGARSGAASWIDASGKLWLFGGESAYCSGPSSYNDLWEYEP